MCILIELTVILNESSCCKRLEVSYVKNSEPATKQLYLLDVAVVISLLIVIFTIMIKIFKLAYFLTRFLLDDENLKTT